MSHLLVHLSLCLLYFLFRKGKVRPFELLQNDKNRRFINLFINMGDPHEPVAMDTASEFVCRLYAQNKTCDVDEARHNKLIQMTGKVDQV